MVNCLIVNALNDNRREPEFVTIGDLAKKVSWMVLMFGLDPDHEANFTAKGRLHLAAGVKTIELTLKAYNRTWK